MMKIISLLLFVAITLSAEPYPRLFSQLGTPLYEADKVLSDTSFSKPLKDKVAVYHKMAGKTLQLGRDVESSELPEMETIRFYHTSLRLLDKKYGEIVTLLKNELHAVTERDDYDGFMRIAGLHLDVLFEQESVKRLAVEYYRKHKDLGKDPYLEKIENDLKQMQDDKVNDPGAAKGMAGQGYDRTLIVLTASWCPVCRRAKAYMKEHHIAFREYDIERSSYGKKLYEERKGFAVPMLIIGDNYLTGFDPLWIKRYLKKQ